MSDELAEKRIGFIGCGAMARALAGGLLAAGVAAERLRASDLSDEQRGAFEAELGIKTTPDNAEVVSASDVVLLCLKPDVVEPALRGLAGGDDLGRPLWISIAAGVRLAKLAGALPGGARIIRTMPNTPALIGAGATALCANAHADAADRAVGEAIFSAVGITWQAPKEDLLDAVTGLSGSGPAYVFLFLEALGDAGVRQGLPRDAAYELAFQTVLGAAELAKQAGRHPAALKDQVTSPGGTTIAGLEQLERGGLRAAVYRAVEAATKRSRELSEDDSWQPVDDS
ncbi:MAG: pyrroline-5-carboxylate reductase [Deltaproteobacteria bacterium]|nr:pyrroline-5-carboxylate reductase [Deltaproteobacteria bacterium]